MFQRFSIHFPFLQRVRQQLPALLLLLSLGCLGALPVAPHLLANVGNPAFPQRTYTDGQCTASDIQNILPLAATSITVPRPLPQAWTLAGRGKQDQDYLNALTCAAAFIESYETFDYHQIKTLYTAIPMLSADAQRRFYAGDRSVSANIRTDPGWQHKVKVTHLIQEARASLPFLLTSAYIQGALYLTLDVPYRVIEQSTSLSSIQNLSATVLLKGAQPDPQIHGLGWQVTDWRPNEYP